ncbi:hypothetical protein MYA_5672 [Burkholderia sp. KJ006]|nr:hypothetical protein MYA_5672 [Burkholderia sp. KJ006]
MKRSGKRGSAHGRPRRMQEYGMAAPSGVAASASFISDDYRVSP